jgi:NAD-dependent SIR2 family protein deacetylase
MKNCKQCGHNDFSFKTKGAYTVVTCKNCSNEFEFIRKKKPVKQEHKCSACGAEMERYKITLTAEALLKPLFYTYNYKCTKCKTEVPDPTTKRINAMYTRST